MEGEAGLPGFDVRALADVGIEGAGVAIVGGVERAVGVQAFGEAEGDLLAGPGVLERKARDAGEVAPEVEDEDAGLDLGDLL